MNEFAALLLAQGFERGRLELTRSNDRKPHKRTIMGVLRPVGPLLGFQRIPPREPALKVEPASGKPGTRFWLTAKYFRAREPLELSVEGPGGVNERLRGSADSSGTWSVKLPGPAVPGRYSCRARARGGIRRRRFAIGGFSIK
jgi:hypothetical protein